MVVLHGTYSGNVLTTHEFVTKSDCEAAMSLITHNESKGAFDNGYNISLLECLEVRK